MQAWAKFADCFEHKPESILSEVIWCNDLLKYKCTIRKSWRSKGLFFLGDLLKGNILLSVTEIEEKYGIRVNMIDYNSIRINMSPVLSLIGGKKNVIVSPAVPPRTYAVLH